MRAIKIQCQDAVAGTQLGVLFSNCTAVNNGDDYESYFVWCIADACMAYASQDTNQSNVGLLATDGCFNADMGNVDDGCMERSFCSLGEG